VKVLVDDEGNVLIDQHGDPEAKVLLIEFLPARKIMKFRFEN